MFPAVLWAVGRTKLADEELGLAGAWLVTCATTMSYLDYDAALIAASDSVCAHIASALVKRQLKLSS